MAPLQVHTDDDVQDAGDGSDEFYLAMDCNKGKMFKQIQHEGFGSRDSGLHTIGEDTEYRTVREEYTVNTQYKLNSDIQEISLISLVSKSDKVSGYLCICRFIISYL